MKTKIAIIISLAVGLISAGAYATDINVDVNLRKITVSASDTAKVDTPTMQVLDEGKTRVIFMTEGVVNNGVYEFETFTMPGSELSGNYIVRIGENGTITQKTFYYAAESELLNLLNDLKSGASSNDIVKKYSGILDVDASNFNALPSTWRDRITVELQKLSISTASPEDIQNSKIAVTDTLTLWLNYAELCTNSNEKVLDSAVAYLSGLGKIDSKDYETLTTKTHVANAFSVYGVKPASVTESELRDMFDGAVLTGIISQADWATGKEKLNEYVKRGLLEIESKYLSAQSGVFKTLKSKKVVDYNKLPSAIKDAYNSQGSGSSSGGGGGGGGGTSVNTTKPVTVTPGINQTDNAQASSTETIVKWLCEPFTLKDRPSVENDILRILGNL